MYSHILSISEQNQLDKYCKVIIWGFPLDSHTHSYIHAMWVKIFKVGFNKDTYWFHDNNYPTEFDYNNCLFITEGYADKNIPIVSTSTYFVHNAIYPERYVDRGARLIEIRFNVNEIHDVNNDFTLDDGTHTLIYLTPHAKYEKLISNKDIHISKRGTAIKNINYECIYLYWGTDLLPHEFNYEDINIEKENKIYYIGSQIYSTNYPKFRNICSKNGIQWITSNPWNTPLTFEKNKLLMQKSILTPDFRSIGTDEDTRIFGRKNGKNHLEIGYLPCRVLKAISYGQIGITDSIHVKKILKEHVLYSDNMEELFSMAMSERNNKEKIIDAMKYVQENHTYVNRAHELIKALCMRV
jgi:hypothetical protein